MTYDLVIRGGTIVDGTGTPRRRGDVAVHEGVVAEVGEVEGDGRHQIEADGLFVTPGFIDGHAHMDAQIFWDPLATPASQHGVTTLIMGNCGFTLAPVEPGAEELAVRSIERAEDMARADLEIGVPWGWRAFGDYLDAVARTPKAVNVAAYLGHSALRGFVMGERAYTEQATEDDLAAMRRELAAGLAAGAVGFSTSRISQHRTRDDGPVASFVADWSEIRALAAVVGERGTGLIQLADDLTDPEMQQAVLALSLETGRPVHQACVYVKRRPEAWRQVLEFLSRADAAGAQVVGQCHVRPLANVIGFRVGLPFDLLPGWRQLRQLPLEAQRARLEDPAAREALVDEALHGPYVTTNVAAEVQARLPDYDTLQVLRSPTGSNPSVAEVAAQRGTNPVDAMIDLSLEADFDQFFTQPFANQDLEAVEGILRHPQTVVAQSDSGAHVSQIMDSSIPTHLLAYWVRQRAALRWEEAVAALTAAPAAHFGLADRGRVQPGYRADLVLFDPERVAPRLPEAASDLPAGGTRLVQGADGIAATVVNGQVTWLDGQPTTARPGDLLRAGRVPAAT